MNSIAATLLLGLLTLLIVAPAHAVTRTWPGVAPCDATLQGCINASAATDTVLVAQSTPIAENLFINQPLLLRPAPGVRPTLAAGFSIYGTVNAPGTWTWSVQGFTLEQGFITLSVAGGTTANVIIRDNRIESDISGFALISVHKQSAVTTALNYDISRNHVDYFWNTFDGGLRAAIQVLDSNTGSSDGVILENRVTARGNESIGILVSTEDRAHRVAVAGNHVFGGHRGSIFLRQGSLISATAGSLETLVTSNVIRSVLPNTRVADGIKVDVYDGSATIDVLHNTVVDGFNGVDLYAETGTTISGNVTGNLFAYLFSIGLQRSGAASVITDSANLFFRAPESVATPGLNPNTLFVDPMLVDAPEDMHLRPGSPAADVVAAATLQARLSDFGLPRTDGDGLRRFKLANGISSGTVLDIGALESGDTTLMHRAPVNTPASTTLVQAVELNSFPLAFPQVTQNWNPNGESGIYNNHPVSFGYNSTPNRWYLRHENLLAFTARSRFNVFAPGNGVGRYLHANTAGNTGGPITELNNVDLNGRNPMILQVVRNPGTGVVVDVPSPLGVNYVAGVWSIVRLDGLAMPVNQGFNVYFQEPSINAFLHRATSANTVDNYTVIDHTLLNGSPCARFHVTQSTDFGVTNNHHVGVFFDGAPDNQWAIFNQDGENIPANAEFHVVVDPQAVRCAAFRDGFES